MASLLTEEDLVLLDRTQDVRKKLITKLDTYYTNKEHIGSKDLESFVGLLDSTDKNIFSRTKIKLEEKNSQTNEESKQILKELLMEMHKKTPNSEEVHHPHDGHIVPEFQPSSLGETVKEGELIRKLDEMDVETVVKNNSGL